MDETFIPDRITQLRLTHNVSEYQMSMELGQSKGYVQAITSGRSMPSMKQLFNIIDYFNMTPSEFFAPEIQSPPELQEAIQALRRLSPEDIRLILSIIRRIETLSADGNQSQEQIPAGAL